MEKVSNLKEAMHFFINNSTGKVICIKNNQEIECESYVDAVKFYTESYKE